jgi:hypothetical protein
MPVRHRSDIIFQPISEAFGVVLTVDLKWQALALKRIPLP